MNEQSNALALKLAAFWTTKNDQGEYLYSSLDFREETAAELRRLHEENRQLRTRFDALLKIVSEGMRDAGWSDKHIYPYRGETFQTWEISIYLPVKLSESDKSPESALERAIDAAIESVKE